MGEPFKLSPRMVKRISSGINVAEPQVSAWTSFTVQEVATNDQLVRESHFVLIVFHGFSIDGTRSPQPRSRPDGDSTAVMFV